MMPSSLRLARELAEVVKPKAFSFDIFDTFLLRRTSTPEGVYERAFHLADIPEGYKGLAESFVQNRMFAEQNARLAALKQNGEAEVTIETIYQYFPVHVFGFDASVRARLVEAEFQAERELCFLNTEIYALWRDLKAKGIKLGFLSDTYWSKEQLHQLLTGVAPDVEYDFLYPSCEHGVSKSNGLFTIYMQQKALEASELLHIGDNPVADVAAPRKLGIQTVFYPQASARLNIIFQRERGIIQMIQSQRAQMDKRLDEGLTVMRRLAVARQAKESDVPGMTGVSVMGPLMTTFQYYLEQRIAEIRQPGRKVKVLFLSRDGHLPLQLWEKANAGEATYVELNTRIAMIGGDDDISAFQEFVRPFGRVDASGMRAFLKTDILAINQFFAQQPGEYSNGEKFADALPDLMDKRQIKALSKKLRQRMIQYLRMKVAEFHSCTDLVIIDIGYRGTIQHALRKCLDREGFEGMRLHGMYLISVDSKFASLRAGDSVSGMIDNSVLAPQALHNFICNIMLLEQFHSAPVGSVRDYDGVNVIHEEDRRPPEQLALCQEVREGALRFFEEYSKLVEQFGIDPLRNMAIARPQATAIILRFLFRPTGEEQQVFGTIKHDMNLGTSSLIDIASLPYTQTLLDTVTFAQLCAMNQPVGWLGGGLSAISPMAAQNYVIKGFGFVESEMLADRQLEPIEAKLIASGTGQPIPASCTITGFGDIRIRIPIPQKYTGSTLAIPLGGPIKHGVVRSLVIQHGENSLKALYNKRVQTIPVSELRYLQSYHSGPYFRAAGTDAYVVFNIPATEYSLAIVTLTITPLPDMESDADAQSTLAKLG